MRRRLAPQVGRAERPAGWQVVGGGQLSVGCKCLASWPLRWAPTCVDAWHCHHAYRRIGVAELDAARLILGLQIAVLAAAHSGRRRQAWHQESAGEHHRCPCRPAGGAARHPAIKTFWSAWEGRGWAAYMLHHMPGVFPPAPRDRPACHVLPFSKRVLTRAPAAGSAQESPRTRSWRKALLQARARERFQRSIGLPGQGKHTRTAANNV